MRNASRFFLLFVIACWSQAADSKRLLRDTDIYAFRWIADAQISPDGSRVIYTLVKATAKHDSYETGLWILPVTGGEARPLTSGVQDSGARWSPDGSMVAFSRSIEKEGKPQPSQIYVLSMQGGEARALTDMPKGASDPVWSPDGRTIAFSSTTLTKDFEKKKAGEEESDVRVISGARYRMNGAGYRDADRPAHIWVVDVTAAWSTPPAKARQLTSGAFDEESATWSRDGATIYFTSDRVKDPEYLPPHDEIFAISSRGGETTRIASIEGNIANLALSPNGRQMAFVAELNAGDDKLARSYSQPDLFVTSLEPGATPRNLTVHYDFDIGAVPGGDQGAPRGAGRPKPWWSADGKNIFVVAGEEGRANLKRVDAESGKVSPLTDGNFAVTYYSASADGHHAAAIVSSPTNIGDLYSLNPKTRELQQITHINSELFSQIQLTEPEMIWYKSFDGRRIQAWVQRPPNFEAGKKYPLILNIHGGPHAAYGYVFDHEFQWMAAKGYIVLYPNPRGSTMYGQDFGNIIQYKYPGDDFKDLMAGVDEVIRLGWVDPDRMGVTGGSGGGVLTNWAIGHTDRFKAAVSQRSIADWTGWWYDADIVVPTWFRGAPWEHEADFKEHSPITYVQNIKTPLMLIEGESDLRTPPANGGEQMFRALKYLKKPVVMVRFPGESHELSRSGKPVHRVERLDHIVGWFDKYLQGKEADTYTLQ